MYLPTTEKEKENYRQALEAAEGAEDLSQDEKELAAIIMALSYQFGQKAGWHRGARLALAIAQTHADLLKGKALPS